jgi:hypothetical protein
MEESQGAGKVFVIIPVAIIPSGRYIKCPIELKLA